MECHLPEHDVSALSGRERIGVGPIRADRRNGLGSPRGVALRAAPFALALTLAAGCGGGTSHGGGASTSSRHSPRTLASATWQGMRIAARAAPATAFVVFNGSSEETVRAIRRDGLQLSVTLTDVQTGVAIPYATVTATIGRGTRTLGTKRLWPMISPSAGPGYVVNTSLPGAGTYRLALVITPPVSARHLEYQHVWLRPHTARLTFRWKPGE
jgi:hypothetical protein